MTDLISWALTLIFVIALILGLSIALKRFIAMNSGAANPLFGKGGKRRLKIMEIQPLDQKSRLVLVRRDDEVEHLILQSQTGDLVIESGITPKREEATITTRPPDEQTT